MTASATQRSLVTLLAIASVGTTVLIGINVLSRYRYATPTEGDLRSGVVAPTPAGDPPVLFALAPFTLTDQLGQALGSRQLRGKIWIADFVFTRCAGPCLAMTGQMTQLQSKLAKHPAWNDIRLVSVSVDPEHDTPTVLQQYAKQANANERHWRFLTGARSDVWKLVRDGFKLPIHDDDQSANMPIFHSQKFVLVDRWGQVRGYYDATEPQDNDQLLRDLNRVVIETTNPRQPQEPSVTTGPTAHQGDP